jgi:hypothetical protein
MSKKDHGAFQRKRAQKMAKQRAKKAKSQRTAKHDIPLAYSGSRYQSERYMMPLMVLESAILEADDNAGGKLLDNEVRAALAIMVRRLHTGPQESIAALNALSITELGHAKYQQIIDTIVAGWLDFFEEHRPLPRADLVGIFRTIVYSLGIRTEMHPGGRGYLKFLAEFLPQAMAEVNANGMSYVVDDDDDELDWEEDELTDEMDSETGGERFDWGDTIDVPHRPNESGDDR